jgi:hypothetical protein
VPGIGSYSPGIRRVGLSTSGGTVSGSIVPSANGTLNLGSSALTWNAIYAASLTMANSAFINTGLLAAGSGDSQVIRGAQAAGSTSAADVILRAVNDRSAGKVVSIQDNNGSAELAYYTFDGKLGVIAGNSQSTVGAAGGASALPATPAGYMKIDVAGTARIIPYYVAA